VNIYCPIYHGVQCKGTLLHKATHITTSFRPFRMTGNRAAFAGIPVCRESESEHFSVLWVINLLKPNDIYICRTAALTSGRCILNIYSTNIHTEYFKQAA